MKWKACFGSWYNSRLRSICALMLGVVILSSSGWLIRFYANKKAVYKPKKTLIPSVAVLTRNSTPFLDPMQANRRNIRMLYIDYDQKQVRDWSSFLENCSDSCTVTSSSHDDDIESADVVIFHAPSISKRRKPPLKRRGQKWIFFSQESPIHHKMNFRLWEGLFNWTMTYRHDSDIKAAYGEFRQRQAKDPPELNVSSAFHKKSVDAAWWVSNCNTQSKRMQYAETLQKHMDIHIYGACKKQYQCVHNTDRCFELLNNTYKFYLSLENSHCLDYVTDKVYKMYDHEIQVIIVVRGSTSPGVYKKILPPHSYINTAEFKTTRDLSTHLKQIGSNISLYQEYFQWQKHYRQGLREDEVQGFCRICKMAHEADRHKRIYNKLSHWLHGGTYKQFCQAPNDIK